MSISRNATYNLVGAVAPMVLGLITVPIYLHLLGADRYGVLSIAFLLLGYFGLFDLGLGRATAYRISALRDADPAQQADVLRSALVVNLGMGAVGAAVLYVAADYFFTYVFKVDPTLKPEMRASVPYLAASVPIATLIGVLTGVLQAREQFLKANMISVVSTALFQLLPLIVAGLLGPRLGPLLAAALVARVISIGALWSACARLMPCDHKARFDRSEARMLLGYGGWVTLTAVFGPILVILDRFAIGAVLGAAAVAIYTVPFQLAQRISVFPGALVGALFPRLPTASTEERIELTDKAVLVLLAALTPPVMVALWAVFPFFEFWIGRTLGVQSAAVAGLIIIGFWINAFAVVPYSWLQAVGRPDIVTKLLLLQIPPYLLILYLAMTQFGLIGSAAVFAIRCAVDFGMMALAARGRISHGGLIGGMSALLLGALAITQALDWHDPIWWAAGILLTALTALWSWRIAPVEIRNRAFQTVRTRLGFQSP